MKYLQHILLVLFIFPVINAAAQEKDSLKVYQLSGLVVEPRPDAEKDAPIPYATIRINRSRRGIIANSQGFYSIPVVETDTIVFLSLGYKPSFLIVKEYLDGYQGSMESPYIYIINYMEVDPVEIKGLVIFPYDTPEKLKTAMLAMETPEFSPQAFAEGNMDPKVLDGYIANMEVDAGERVMVGRQMYYQQYQSKNLAQVVPLIDPIAVYRLLKHISDKAKRSGIRV